MILLVSDEYIEVDTQRFRQGVTVLPWVRGFCPFCMCSFEPESANWCIPQMSTIYPDPPTEATLQNARRELSLQRDSLSSLTSKIAEAELALSQLVSESQSTINGMHKERLALERKMENTMGYIAPIRRLPQELLRGVFSFAFEDYPCCAWVLSAVCSLWRRMALSMPTIWSKVCIV